MMTQATILELAKQGNPKAIATLISRSLQPQGVTAKAGIRGNCLRVMLESQQVPNEQASVQCIRQGLTKLDVKSIQTVQVFGKQIGKDSPAWIQDFELVVSSSPLTEELLPDEAVRRNLSTDNYLILTGQNIQNYQMIQNNSINNLNATDKKQILRKSNYRKILNSFLSLKVVSRVLFIFLSLRIIFDIVFVFYSATWTTSLVILNLLDTVDTTGIFTSFSYSVFNFVDFFWLPLKAAGNWIYLLALFSILLWLYRLHVRLKALFNGYSISPWGAIARFLIPIYSLWGIWNLFATLANKLKSQSDDLVHRGSSIKQLLPWLYITFITSNLLDQIYKFEVGGSNPEVYSWIFVVSNIMNLGCSVVLLQMARLVKNAIAYQSRHVNEQHSE